MSLLLLNVLWQVSILALVTLGLAIIFGQLQIMNMAHGELIMIGAYSGVIANSLGLPFWAQLPLCILIAGISAIIIERLVIRHLYRRVFDSLLATWAVGILLREIVIAIFGRGFQHITTPIDGTVIVFGTTYPIYRLILIAGIIIFFSILYFYYKRSHIGLQIRAMVANPNLASSMGINVAALSRNVFIFGAVLTSVAGWLIAPTTRVDPFMGLDYLVRSFFALVVGGVGSIEGLLFGTGIIAGLQTIISTHLDQVSGYVIILLVSIGFLWRRPHGIINKS